MNEPTHEQIAKLPKWAQDRLTRLEGQREEAVKALNLFVDNQTEAPVSYMMHPGTGEQAGPSFKKAYIQTDRLTITWAGVSLDVFLARQDDPQRMYGIELSWSGSNSNRYVAMIPRTHQGIQLVAKENL